MKASLHIQDPSGGSTLYGIDAIVSGARRATSGRAMFAFATVDGINLLLGHEATRRLAFQGGFEVVVGIDAITNRQALECLQRHARDLPRFFPKVFWNSTAGLFHPKLCHFKGRRHETWIVGSGNLTPRGMRDSFEAFSVIEGTPKQLTALDRALDNFLALHASSIRDIDDDALERASKNKFTSPLAIIEPPKARVIQPPIRAANPVLIAELPKGGNRWQQANFDRETARVFFHVDPSSASLRKELFLNEVDARGHVISEETRRFTFTRSRNLRIQIAAKSGESYPKSGRPIAMFREIKPRHFVYQLLLPGEKGFRILAQILDRFAVGTIRRHLVDLSEFKNAWPRCPLV